MRSCWTAVSSRRSIQAGKLLSKGLRDKTVVGRWVSRTGILLFSDLTNSGGHFIPKAL